MNETWDALAHICFRPAPGLRLLASGNTWLAITSRPLRVLRLTAQAGAILAHCDGTCSVRAIAAQLPGTPVATVAATCAHLSWRGLLRGDAPPLPTPAPTVAIIIPTRHRAPQLRACLQSLRGLTYSREQLEIIVVDDASTDDTTAVLQAATTQLPLTTLHNEQQSGGALCRNRAAAATHADILAFTDSDCLVSPTWLSDLVPYLCLPGIHIVGGAVRAADLHSAIGRYEDAFSSLRRGPQLQELTLDGPTNYLATANLLIRRTTFAALGGFAALRYGEDVDLCWRLLAAGKRALAVPGGTIAHAYRVTPRGFAATRVAYASSEGILTRRHPAQRRRLALPPEPAAFALLTLVATAVLWHTLDLLLRSYWASHEDKKIEPQRTQRDTEVYSTLLGSEPDFPWKSGAAGSWARGRDARAGQLPAPPERPLCIRPSLKAPIIALPLKILALMNVHQFSGISSAGPKGPARYAGPSGPRAESGLLAIGALLAPLGVTGVASLRRTRAIRRQQVPLGAGEIALATFRGHLAYLYHLCQHLNRYYLWPLALATLLWLPLLPVTLAVLLIPALTDYCRQRPRLAPWRFLAIRLLDHAAYGPGVAWGAWRHRCWRALVPRITRS
jgi:mycofactocin system glycosyltransferase